jgi:hypothetical protein
MHWIIKILLTDGTWRLIKSLGLGVLHAILNELGNVEPRVFT